MINIFRLGKHFAKKLIRCVSNRLLMGNNERIKTYIERFDDVLKGGIPQGHVVLICGAPGTYKSTITLNLLANNSVKDGKKGLYITLEEPKESLHTTAKGIGMPEWEDENLLIADLGMMRLQHEADDEPGWIDYMENYIKRRVKEGVDIIVLDSLSALYSLYDIDNPRKELFRFFGTLRKLGVTFLLISEVTHQTGSYGEYCEDFLSDGIIYLNNYAISDTESQLRIKCVKMRHVHHSKNFFSLMLEDGKFQIARVISQRGGSF